MITVLSDRKRANKQANAPPSTEPRTDEGKAKLRLDARVHGLRAETLALPLEGAGEFGVIWQRIKLAQPTAHLIEAGLATEPDGANKPTEPEFISAIKPTEIPPEACANKPTEPEAIGAIKPTEPETIGSIKPTGTQPYDCAIKPTETSPEVCAIKPTETPPEICAIKPTATLLDDCANKPTATPPEGCANKPTEPEFVSANKPTEPEAIGAIKPTEPKITAAIKPTDISPEDRTIKPTEATSRESNPTIKTIELLGLNEPESSMKAEASLYAELFKCRF